MNIKTATLQTLSHLKKEIRGKTALLAFVVAVLFVVVLGLLPNIPIIAASLFAYDFSSIFYLYTGLLIGIFTASAWYTGIVLVLLATLTGLNVALLVTRASRLRRAGVTGIGSFFGLLLGGCPSCATGLLPAFGLAGVLSFLPLGGIELSLLGILILLVSLYWNATAERCNI